MRFIPRTRRRRLLLSFFCLLIFIWFAGPRLLAPMVQSKLQKMVAGQFNARVEIGSLSYMPPYGVRARNLQLISEDPESAGLELLGIKELDLKLAKLPFGSGPLVVQEIRVIEPSLHLVQTADGLAGRIKPAPPGPVAGAAPTPPPRRSDMFLLRHFTLQGGQIVYEDRERPDLPPMVWSQFSVDMSAAQRSRSTYEFQIGAAHGNLANLKANGSFDIDDLWIEASDLQATVQTATREQSALPPEVQRVLVNYGIAGQLALQTHGRFAMLDPRASAFDGSIDIKSAKASIPGVSQSVDQLDARLRFRHPGAASTQPSNITIENLNVIAAGQQLHVSQSEVIVDAKAARWSVEGLTAVLSDSRPTTASSQPAVLPGPGSLGGSADVVLSAAGNLPRPESRVPSGPLVDADRLSFEIRPHGLTVWPKKYPQPVEDIRGGIVTKRKGTRVVTFENLVGRYGTDPVSLTSARMPLAGDATKLKVQWRVEEIVGAIEFRQPVQVYPRGMNKVVQRLRPSGRVAIGGGSWFELNEVPIVPGDPPTMRPIVPNDPEEAIDNAVKDAADAITFAGTSGIRPVLNAGHKADYFFSISSDSLAFNFLEGRLPMTAIRGDATFSPLAVRIDRIEGELLGGSVSGQFQVIPKRPFPASGKLAARNLDLEQLALVVPLTSKQREKLSGTAAIDSTLEAQWATTVPERLNSIRAVGEFEVFNGNFWSLPILKDLVGEVDKKNDNLASVGEAAGRFQIADGMVELQHVAVCAPALGLIGSGNITLADKQLKLQVVAAPLGDWRDRMKQSKVPILRDVAGEVVGAIQQVLNTATGAVLYQFEVTGTTNKPQVRAIPAPVLTEGAGRLFLQMLNPDQQARQWSATARKSK